jgi:hypothetical protein
VLLHPDKLCSPFANPVVGECSSGLLVEVTKAADPSGGEEVKLVCYPYPKVYEMGNASADKIDWPSAPSASSPSKLKIFKLEITDNARLVSLYRHHTGGWRICSPESSDCSDKICRMRVKREDPGGKGSEEGEGDHYYLMFKNSTHYSPWTFFEETLAKPRQSFATFSTASSNSERKRNGDDEDDDDKKSRKKKTNEGPDDDDDDDEGQGQIHKTFGDFFWDIWHEKGYRYPDDASLCYSFMVSVRAIQIFNHLTPQGTYPPTPCAAHMN